MVCPSCGELWIEGNTACACGATMTKRYTGILKGSRVIGVPVVETKPSPDFESLEYIKRRIEAGNDLSPKHKMILLDRISFLKEEVRSYKILFDAIEEIAEQTEEGCFDCPMIAQKALSKITHTKSEMEKLLQEFIELMEKQHTPKPFDMPPKTYDKSYHGGDCSKHGRYYGICQSCEDAYKRDYANQSREFESDRYFKLIEIKNKVKALLSKHHKTDE